MNMVATIIFTLALVALAPGGTDGSTIEQDDPPMGPIFKSKTVSGTLNYKFPNFLVAMI